MTSPYTHALLTVIVLIVLFWVSLLFNNYIDRRHKKRDDETGDSRPQQSELLYDGETAVWVMLGTTYTNIGAAALVLIWWHELRQIEAPWRGAVFVGSLIFACYIASGIPMAVGDAVRSLNLRSGKQ